jgi:hypothetical protein
MNTVTRTDASQRGVALIVSLLFLLVVTLISVVAATNSSRSLKMATNMQDMTASFQAAEAGAYATLGLVDTANDPYQRSDNLSPFAGLNANEHPLRNLPDPNAVDVQVFAVALDRECPRPPGELEGTGVDVLDCDYYRVESRHGEAGRARTQIQVGVVKMIIDRSNI